jgi:hypothetical protein
MLAAAACAAALFVFAWLLRFNDPDGSFANLTDDHFFYLVRGWQILFGELPVRDFVDHGAPLYYYVAAAVQVLFGRGTLSEVVFSVTMLAACAVGVFLLAARASGSVALGASGALFHILLAPRFYNYPKILAYVLAIPALWAFADRQSTWRTVLAAVVTVVSFLLRHDHGVFIAAAFAVLLCVLPQLTWRDRIRHGATYGAIVLALLAPYLLFIEVNGGVVTYFETAAAWAQRDRDRAPVVFPSLSGTEDDPESRAIARLFYTELALPLVALGFWAVSKRAFRPTWPNASAKLAVVAALGLMLNAGFLRAPLEARLADPSVPHAVVLAWLPVAIFGLLFRRDEIVGSGRRAWLTPAAVVLCGVAALLLVVAVGTVTNDLGRRLEKVALHGRLEDGFERAGLIWDRIRESFPIAGAPDADPDHLNTLALYLRECTRPDDRIFVQHYIPQVLALGERGFAGGHADLRPGFFTSETMQRLTVARLSRQSVPVALVGAGDEWGGLRTSFPIVVAYLDRHFERAAEHTFDGRFEVRLLVNRAARATGRFEPLGWPCFGP